MKTVLELLRINEWYKNITVVLGVIFALFLLNINLSFEIILKITLVLILSCLVSSSNYILNAITDRKYDSLHPKKKLRPIPSKKISLTTATFLLSLFLFFSLYISLFVFDIIITSLLLLLFIAALFYNIKPIRLKDQPYIDVISESINNPIRFMAGWFSITPSLPNIYLLFFVWSSACILMTKKRLDELTYHKKESRKYRPVFKHYSKSSLNKAIIFYTTISAILFLTFILTII